MWASLASYINDLIIFGSVVMFGALGEILIEKSGHLNLGIPGIIYLGAFGGWFGGFLLEKIIGITFGPLLILSSLFFALLFSLFGSLIYAFFTVTLKSNQNVTGLALTYLSVGVCSFGGQYVLRLFNFDGYAKVSKTTDAFSMCPNILFKMQALDQITQFIGKAFLNYGFMIFVAVALAILMHYFLNKTNAGLSLRSIGENPATSDSQSIPVDKFKYLAIIIGGAIASLGGVTYIMNSSSGIWSTKNNIEAFGWLSVALVIFSTWKPLNAIWGSYLFAALYWLYNYSKSIFGLALNNTQQSLVQMLPYVITIVVLVIASFRKNRELQPPESLGLSYFREDR